MDIQYKRNDVDFQRGTFRVRGDVVEVLPVYERNEAVRIEFFGDQIDRILAFDPLTGKGIRELDRIAIYPASHVRRRHAQGAGRGLHPHPRSLEKDHQRG